MTTLVIGVDPGLTTGLCAIECYGDGLHSDPVAVQVAGSRGVLPIVRALDNGGPELILAVEQFVVGPRAARSATPAGGAVARALIDALTEYAGRELLGLQLRTAAAVKPWATDKRLHAAGLADACKGMPHARDAARHALFAAVHTGLLRDPLAGKAVGE